MSVKRTENGWKVDFRVGGRNSKRVIRIFPTKGECERYERWVKSQHDAGKPWSDNTSGDKRRLSELVERWYVLHGQHLKDGIRRRDKLLSMASDLKDPIAQQLSAKAWANYRAGRSAAGISPKTLNNELGYMHSLFNKLLKSGEISYSSPLDSLETIKIAERELSFLTEGQIDELLRSFQDSDNPHVELITLVSLATGARWGEAEGLTANRVHNGMVTFTDTKNGRNRSVPVPEWLYERLKIHTQKGKLFSSSIGAFRRALARTSIDLPKGQAAHVLRHTFASHFMMNGGNILTLQKILGHSDIKMTMRYAHLAPDHFQDAARLNPVAKLPHSYHTDAHKRA